MDSRFEDFTSLERAAKTAVNRRLFIGGSDARIIMSPDEAALIRSWKEKRGEAEPEYLSDDLVVQLGAAAEAILWRPGNDLMGRVQSEKRCSSRTTLQSGLSLSPKRACEDVADAAAIFGNELYATGFEAPHYHHFKRGAIGLMGADLELAHSHNANSSLFREFVLAPIKEAGRARFRARLSVGFP